ncbi:MAG: alpha/beta hydrolase-fold protein [Actinomycetota bacterium]
MGAVSVISPGFLATLGVVVALAWLAVRRVGRGQSRRRTVLLAAVGAAVLSLVLTADVVNAHYQYLPRVADVFGHRTWPDATPAEVLADRVVASSDGTSRRHSSSLFNTLTDLPWRRSATSLAHSRGAVVPIRVGDAGVGFKAERVLVYLPPQYFTEPTAHFPVVYLLHGSPGMPVDWLRGGGAARSGLAVASAGHPQILVMPRMSRNWLDDSECVNGRHLRVEDYLIRDVVPGIDAQLRTMPDRAHRTVAGMSAGGFCALNLGLRNRGAFGSIIDMSGYTHPTHHGGMVPLFGSRADLATVVAANSPDVYAARLAPTPKTRLYLLCGTGDHDAMRPLASIRDLLRGRGFDVTWSTRRGGHTYGVWRPALVTALEWAAPNDF